MLSIPIQDIKSFMSHLMVGESFDRFYLIEATIKMGVSYYIDGHLNKDFFDTDIRENLSRDYCYWKEVRPKVFSFIKGKRLPLGCKIVLSLPKSYLSHLIKESGGTLREEDIEGLYLNIIYDPDHLILTTGISYRVFTMDKSLEHVFEDYIRSYLLGLGIH